MAEVLKKAAGSGTFDQSPCRTCVKREEQKKRTLGHLDTWSIGGGHTGHTAVTLKSKVKQRRASAATPGERGRGALLRVSGYKGGVISLSVSLSLPEVTKDTDRTTHKTRHAVPVSIQRANSERLARDDPHHAITPNKPWRGSVAFVFVTL